MFVFRVCREQGFLFFVFCDPCIKVKVLFFVGAGNSAFMVSVALGFSGISQAIHLYMGLFGEYRRYFGRDVPLGHCEICSVTFLFCLLGARSEGRLP